jgi:hypothetical protein
VKLRHFNRVGTFKNLYPLIPTPKNLLKKEKLRTREERNQNPQNKKRTKA